MARVGESEKIGGIKMENESEIGKQRESVNQL